MQMLKNIPENCSTFPTLGTNSSRSQFTHIRLAKNKEKLIEYCFQFATFICLLQTIIHPQNNNNYQASLTINDINHRKL